MRLGRVVGKLWCSVKDESLNGRKLLVIQPITDDGKDAGQALVALDAIGAGAGETIYWCRGREAALAFLPDLVGSDASVVGIVDTLNASAAAAPHEGAR